MSVKRSIEDYEDAYRGDAVWIVGNGPSTELFTMDRMRAVGGYVMGTNRCWKTSPRTGASFQDTDFHTFIAGQHLDDLIRGSVRTKVAFVPHRYGIMMTNHPAWVRWRGSENSCSVMLARMFMGKWNPDRQGRPFGFNFKAGGVISFFAGHTAIALAVFMGFDEIRLVGFDAQDGSGHFFDDEPSDPASYTRDSMRKWFDAIAEWWATQSRVRIVNCNPESAIRHFPFKTLEEYERG